MKTVEHIHSPSQGVMMTKCPTCESKKVKPSVSGNRDLFILVRLFVRCMRCQPCGRRFYCPIWR